MLLFFLVVQATQKLEVRMLPASQGLELQRWTTISSCTLLLFGVFVVGGLFFETESYYVVLVVLELTT